MSTTRLSFYTLLDLSSACFVGHCGFLHSFFFFFQAEDGIRDLYVTGVQTYALPILPGAQGGNTLRQGRPLLHRGRRPGGPGPVRRCLVAACGYRAAGPGLPAMDLQRLPVLRAGSRRATAVWVRVPVLGLSGRIQPEPDLLER